MKQFALSIGFCVLSASAAFAQTKTSVEGVWKIAEVVLPATNPEAKGTPITVTNPQPGLIIFTKGYFGGMAVTGPTPRATVAPAKDPQNLTDAEKIARYEQCRNFIANSGNYEIKGSTLIMHPIVSKEVAGMATGIQITWEFKLEDVNTLRLIPTGDQSATVPKIRLIRLE